MCRAHKDGGRRCGALGQTRRQGNEAREAMKEAQAQYDRVVSAVREGDTAAAKSAAKASYAAFKRADAAQKAAHEAAGKGTTDRAQQLSAGAARRATSLADRASRAAKAAQLMAKSDTKSATAKAASRGVLGSAETAEWSTCRECVNGQVIEYDQDNKVVDAVDCVTCEGAGTVAA